MNTTMLSRKIKRVGRKPLGIFLALIALGLFSNTAFAVSIPSNFFTVVDSGGANDVKASQNDLTQMGRDDSDPNYYELFWSWDTTDFAAQKGNACALFDTNGNENIDYAICAEIENVPSGNPSVVKQTIISPVAVTCSDASDDRCTQPSGALAFTSSDIQSGDLVSLAASPPANLLTDTDPFANLNPDQNHPNDSTIRIKIAKSFLPANAVLANVCTYPSLGNTGNNNPFDCVLNPGSGFLKITKVAPDGTTQTFNFTVNPGSLSKSITGNGTTGGFPLLVGSNHSVAETIPANWQLDAATCALESGGVTGAKSGNTVSGITIQSGEVTTCTFTNSLAGTKPALALTKTSDANHNGTFADVETVPADVIYPYVVPYRLVIVNNSGSLATVTAISDDKTNVGTAPSTQSPTCASLVGTTIGANASLTCYYDVTFANPNIAQVVNIANVTATNAFGTDTKTDTATVNFTAQSPNISLIKSATEANYDAVGDVIHYTLVATNDGNVTLTNVSISDSKLGTLTCTQPVTLAPGASLTCTGSYTVSQADVDFNQVDNTASTTGTPPVGSPVTDTDTESVPAAQAPHISIVKSATEANYDAVGDVIHYTLVATNDGNVTLTNVSISDPKLGTLTCTQPVTLAPGESLTCTGSYTVTQADVDGGEVDNTASTTGTPPIGSPVTDTDSVSVPAAQAPHITLVKSAAEANYDAAGNAINYTLVATNDGNVTLTAVSINDPKLGALTCTQPVTLAPGASLTCTGSYTVTQADVDAGEVTNTASTTGTPPVGSAVTDTDSENVPADQKPHITLVKNASEASYDAPGDIIHYTLVATNDGSVTLTAVSISDPKLGTLTCTQPVTLAPGASLTCTGSYTVTQADVDAGEVDNTASTTGTPPVGNAVTNTDSENVPATQSANITLVKSATEANYDAVGDIIHYTLVATNDGNVTLTAVSINDPKLGTLTCTQPVTLAPGASLTCTGSYSVTQADVDAGEVPNTASTTGTPPVGSAVTDTDSVSVPAAQSPHITLVKSASEASYDAPGDIIHYTLVATNDGNVTLTAVSINDPKLGTLTCTQPVTLAPGASLTCTGSYTVTQADVDAGEVDNTASTTGTPPVGSAVTDTDSENVPATQSPHITLVKSATEANYDAAGDVLNYTLVATNDGNVTLNNVSISDPKLGTLTCTQPVTLAPGESLTCTGSYSVTQADVDAGEVANTASTTGTSPKQVTVEDMDSENVPAAQAPHISIVKSASEAGYDAAGDIIHYTLVATNDGNVTLTAVSISDPKLGTLTCIQPVTLAPGASLTCTGSYTVTQTDVDAGLMNNTASTTGTPSIGSPVTDTDSVSVPAAQSPHISIVKSASEANYDAAGDAINYTLVATNDGNVTLNNVSISDPKLGTLTCTQPVTLAPGESLTCTGSYTVTQADMDAGEVDNTASTTGTPPSGTAVTDTDIENVPADQRPHITIVKSATEANYDAPGDAINYTLVATNDGSVTLSNVSISDPKLGTLTCTQPVTLAPDESLSCTGSYTVSQADVDAGEVANTASTTGTAPNEETVDDTDSENVPAAQSPHITLVKSAAEASYDAAGDAINYTLVATNDGNVTLTAVSISDPKLGALTCTQPVTLAPGESLTCTGSYTVTQADVDAGEVDNSATAFGTDPNQVVITDTDTESVPAAQAPHITIDKSASEANYDATGDVITYTLIATNDGNVTLSNVSISDPKLGTLTCTQPVTLAPGASLTCTGSYSVTQADVDDGQIDNTASTTGTDPDQETVEDTDSLDVPAIQNPQLTLTKQAEQTGYDQVGDVISYTLVATNSGNVTLNNVSISDPKLGTLTCAQPVTLVPSETLTCTGSYTVTQADMDAKQVDNTASTIGAPPNGPAVTNTDTETVPAIALTLNKVALETDFAEVGDVLHYNYILTNSGNVTLFAPFTVTDDKAPVSCPVDPASLAPGESLTCTASYTVTQADVDAEAVTNLATATAKDPQNNDVTSNQEIETVTLLIDPTSLPEGEQPQAGQVIFLPTIQTQE